MHEAGGKGIPSVASIDSRGLSPAERSLRSRIAAHTQHANGRTNTVPARAAFEAKFYFGIPADLPQAERDRRASHARKAYFARLSLAGSRARRRAA